MESVPLERRFTPVPADFQKDSFALDEVWSGLSLGTHKSWNELLDEYRVVILAEAGAGKTYELKSAAERLVAQGRPGFFIRIEDIDDNFGAAFEIGSETVFEEWLTGEGEAWFFLDSVDEIRLTDPCEFERAIRGFAERICAARQRAHIYISSRPYAWRPALDRALIEELLPFDPQQQEAIGDDVVSTEPLDGAVEGGGFTAVSPGKHVPPVQLYQLAPLDKVEIGLFAERSGVNDSAKFLAELERSALFSLARLPFDLHDLIATWLETHAFASRLNILQEGIRRQLTLPTLHGAALDFERAAVGAQLIAVAAVLTGRPSIRLPSSVNPEAIDAEVLLPDWTVVEIEALLATGVFDEPIFGVVRFRHREVRELLAAQWINAQLVNPKGRNFIESKIFSNHYDEVILTPRLRPVLPWLILFDEAVRIRILDEHPEVAVEGGDAASLPFEARRNMLSKLISQVIDPVSGLRGLDNDAIARIAQADLGVHALDLIEKHFDSDDAIFVLGRLVWQGEMRNCVASLARIAVNPVRGIYARMVSVRAVACVGTPEQLNTMWRLLNSNIAPIPRRLLAELADNAAATAETIDLIQASIGHLEPYEQFEVSGLTDALNGFIQRIPVGAAPEATELLLVFAEGLQLYLGCEPHVDRYECHVSEAYQWLLAPALHCVERLIVARSRAALSAVPFAILVAAPVLSNWRENAQVRQSVVRKLVPQWPELNDALYWWQVSECRAARGAKGEELKHDWPISCWGHFWSFDETSFVRIIAWIREDELPDNRLIALSRAVRTYFENDRPEAWVMDLLSAVTGHQDLEVALECMLNPPVPASTQRYERDERNRRDKKKRRVAENAKAHVQFVERLSTDPEVIRHPPGLKSDQLSSEQYYLLRIIDDDKLSSSRTSGANWEALIPEFGLAVAEAYRDAATAFWRAYKAGLRSEGADRSSIPYALIFAMSGLDIELGGNAAAAAALGEADARRVLRYVTWELNGFPRWFKSFCLAWPQLVREFLWQELVWELEHTPAEQSLHYVLQDIASHAPWLHGEFGPLLCEWLLQHQVLNGDCLQYCRAIMMGGSVTASKIADLAKCKIDDGTLPEQLATWYALRTDADPALSVPALTAMFEAGSLSDPAGFACAFCVDLLGGRWRASPIFGNFKTPTHLKELYLLMHSTVSVADDLERAGKGVYSPTLRDDAQDARERLFALLTQIPGELTYRAILELSSAHPVPRYRDYMRTHAYQRAVVDGDLPAWSVSEVARMAQRYVLPPVSVALCGGEGNATA